MANTIKVTLQVDDNGSLSIVQKQAERAAASTENLNKKKNTYNRQEKGVAGLTSNSTKAFAKQAQTIGGGGGLVPAYATLAANVFAITAAFGVLQRSAAVKQLEEGLIFTGRAAGANLPIVVQGLREITGAAVSTADAMKAVAVGTSAGFSQSQMEGLAKVAKGASLALGRNMPDALDRLTRGAAKLEPEILDELGIMVRLDDATEKYAASIGKTVSELTQFQRRMAFTNAIIAQGEEKFGALAAVIDTNPYDKLAASFDNLTKTVLNGLNTAFGPIVGFIADNLGVLIGLLGMFATGVARQMVPALTAGGTKMAELATETADAAKAQLKGLKSFKGAPKVFDSLAEKVANGTASMEEHQQLVTSLDKSQKAHARTLDDMIAKHGEESKQMTTKRATMAGITAAQQQLEEVTKANAVATRLNTQANALNAASQGNIKEMLTALKAAWALDIAATNADTASKGILTRALAFLTTGFKLTTFSIKVFTIALINAIPIIGQIIMVMSIAWSYLSDWFSTPPTALDEALEKNKERFKEFPDILAQMNAGIAAATTKSQEFLAALSPTTGILNQVADATKNLLDVQKREQLGEKVKKRLALINAEQKLAKAEEAAEAAGLDPNEKLDAWDRLGLSLAASMEAMGGYYGAASEASGASTSLKMATKGVAEAQTELNAAQEAMGKINSLATFEGFQAALVEGIIFMEESTVAMEGNAEATDLANKKLKGMRGILSNLTKDNLPESVEQLQRLKEVHQEIENSAKAAADAVAGVTALFAKSAQPTGEFADHISALGTALDAMSAGTDYSAIMELYKEVFVKYGADSVATLQYYLDLFKEVAKVAKEKAMYDEHSKQYNMQRNAAGLQTLSMEYELAAATKAKLEAQEATGAALISTDPVKILTAVLAEEKAITEELQAQIALRFKLADDARRVGGDTMGAGADFGAAAESAVAMGGLDGASAGLTSLNAASKSTIENLRKMGPEGEVSAALLGGAMNMAEAWSTAFDTITEKGIGSQEGIKSAMQATGATINAISQMQQASAKQKVAAIDKEIAAEKKKDGKSQESLAKIAQLEKKKEAIERKAFEQKKKMQMAEVVMATGVAIMNSIKMGLPWGLVFGTMAAAMGAAQLSAISSQTFDGGSSSVGTGGPSSIGIGQRGSSIDLAKSQGGAGELAYLRGAQGLGGAENFRATNAFTGAKYRASGGNTAYMVGEQGPELFVPERPGRIESADDTAAMGSPMNVNFSINAVDATGIEDLLIGQRGNIIGMLRDAANSTGAQFMENVDIGQYTPSSTGAKRY